MQTTCQLFQMTGETCAKPAQGIVVPQGSSVLAIAREDKPLCQKDGRRILKTLGEGAQWLPLAKVENLVALAATPTPEGNDPMQPLLETPTLASPPTDVVIATNGQTQDASSPVDMPASVDVTPDTPPPAPVPPPVKPLPTVVCEEANTLYARVAELRAEAQRVPSVASALEQAAKGIERSADKLQHAANVAAAAQAKLDAQPVKILHPLGADYVALKVALYAGGDAAIRAFEHALATGTLTFKAGKKARPATTPSDPTTPKTPSTRGHSPEVKAQVLALKAEGKSDKTIGALVGLPDSTVYSICKRAA
jgi:hypothetical protein